MNFQLRPDLKVLKAVSRDVLRAAKEAVRAATKRAVEITREEVGSKRLAKGIQPELDLKSNPLEGRVVAEYYDTQRPRQGVLHLPSGKTKRITLGGGGGDSNVLEDIATGTGVRGPRGRMILPRKSRVLLIGVDSVKPGESYITAGGRYYVLRPRSKGMRPDDYIDRAADRVEGEVDGIVAAAFAAEGV